MFVCVCVCCVVFFLVRCGCGAPQRGLWFGFIWLYLGLAGCMGRAGTHRSRGKRSQREANVPESAGLVLDHELLVVPIRAVLQEGGDYQPPSSYMLPSWYMPSQCALSQYASPSQYVSPSPSQYVSSLRREGGSYVRGRRWFGQVNAHGPRACDETGHED